MKAEMVANDDEMDRALAADREKLIALGGDPGPTEEELFGEECDGCEGLGFYRFGNNLTRCSRCDGSGIEMPRHCPDDLQDVLAAARALLSKKDAPDGE